MRVFIFEHICGGGLADHQELTSRLLWEGGAMLRAIVEDFVALGVEVTTTRDSRSPLRLDGAKVTSIDPGCDFPPIFDRLVRAADATLVIAPELESMLERWSQRVVAQGGRLLGCGPEAVAKVSDKLGLAGLLQKAGVPTPATTLGIQDPPPAWPVVVKPRRGAGCERTFICHGLSDFRKLPLHDDWIVQPLIKGLASSAAYIVDESAVRPLLAGQQFIAGKSQFFYNGGRLPLPADLAHRALALGERAIRALPGLYGYIGVDLVMGDSPGGGGAGDAVIEVNPRPTVAYVGLRKLCKTNLAAALLDHAAPLAWRDGRLNYDAAGEFGWEQEP